MSETQQPENANHTVGKDASSRAARSVPDAPQTSVLNGPVKGLTRVPFVFVALLFARYVTADRVAPWSDQARLLAWFVTILPNVSGVIEQVAVTRDQLVTAGELLVQIEQREY